MMNLPKTTELDLSGKKVLVRADLEFTNRESPRGTATDNIIKYLKDHNVSKIKIIGHKGMPEMLNWWKDVEVVFDIRRDTREMENSTQFAEELANGWEVYVNESFAESHREYTSIVALPLQFKSKSKNSVAAG